MPPGGGARARPAASSGRPRGGGARTKARARKPRGSQDAWHTIARMRTRGRFGDDLGSVRGRSGPDPMRQPWNRRSPWIRPPPPMESPQRVKWIAATRGAAATHGTDRHNPWDHRNPGFGPLATHGVVHGIAAVHEPDRGSPGDMGPEMEEGHTEDPPRAAAGLQTSVGRRKPDGGAQRKTSSGGMMAPSAMVKACPTARRTPTRATRAAALHASRFRAARRAAQPGWRRRAGIVLCKRPPQRQTPSATAAATRGDSAL